MYKWKKNYVAITKVLLRYFYIPGNCDFPFWKMIAATNNTAMNGYNLIVVRIYQLLIFEIALGKFKSFSNM